MGKVCRDGNILPVGLSPKSVVYNRNRVSIVAKSLLLVLAFVFAYAGAWAQSVTVYQKVTSITNGNKYLIVSRNSAGSGYALGYTVINNNATVASDDVTINAGITATDNAVYISASDVDATSVWTAATGWTFKNGNYYVNRKNNTSVAISTNSANWVYNTNLSALYYYTSGGVGSYLLLQCVL